MASPSARDDALALVLPRPCCIEELLIVRVASRGLVALASPLLASELLRILNCELTAQECVKALQALPCSLPPTGCDGALHSHKQAATATACGYLQRHSPIVRAAAVLTTVRLSGCSTVAEELAQALEVPLGRPKVEKALMDACRRDVGGDLGGLVKALELRLSNDNWELRASIIRVFAVLGEVGFNVAGDTLSQICKRLGDSNVAVRSAAVSAIGSLVRPSNRDAASDTITSILADTSQPPGVGMVARRVLVSLHSSVGQPADVQDVWPLRTSTATVSAWMLTTIAACIRSAAGSCRRRAEQRRS